MDMSFSMKSVIVAEEIFISPLPNCASKREKGQSRERRTGNHKIRKTKKRKYRKELNWTSWKKEGKKKAWRWKKRGQRKVEEVEEGSKDKDTTEINLVRFAGASGLKWQTSWRKANYLRVWPPASTETLSSYCEWWLGLNHTFIKEFTVNIAELAGRSSQMKLSISNLDL